MNIISISERDIRDFCQKDVFKQYVRNAVNDEFFWREVFNNYRVGNLVESKLSDAIPNRVNGYLNNVLSGLVAKEIINQLPNIVNSNYQMKQLLAEHSQNLHKSLEEAARKILKQIVNEDQYHEVNQEYFKAFENRTNASIQTFNRNGNASEIYFSSIILALESFKILCKSISKSKSIGTNW